MADETVVAPAAQTSSTETSASPASAAAASPAAVTAPATQTSPTDSSATSKEAAPAASVSSADKPAATAEAKTETKPEPVASPLLSADEPKKEEKADGKDKAQESSDESKIEADPVLPTYEAFKLPEGAKTDEAKLLEFSKSLGEFEKSSKASHEEVQKFGQSLIDKHVAAVQEAVTRRDEQLVHAWNERKAGWMKEFDADPELGGKRKETTLANAKEFIKTHGGPPEFLKDFYGALKETGMDSHPAMVRFITNVMNSQAFRKPTPLAASKPAVTASKISKRYGNN